MKRAILLTVLTSCAGWGQSPSFEVASIKKGPVEGPMAHTTGCFSGAPFADPGMYMCYNATVALMAFQAYGLKQYQMSGVNDDKDKYSVRAKLPAGASKSDIPLMLRNLLAERFKLTFHYEPTEMPVYELVTAKSGPRMHEASEPKADAAPANPPGKTVMDADGFPIYPSAPGSVSMSRANGLVRMRANAAPIEKLVSSLLSMLAVPVFDSTGLAGKYDFTMTFTVESIGQAKAGSDPADGLPIFAALEKELGLKLEKSKRTVDVFVIDHLDKSAAEN